jgi:hypothetical protein
VSSFHKEIERIIGDATPDRLDVLLYYYGITFNVYRERQSADTVVFGKAANAQSDLHHQIEALLIDDGYFPSDDILSGNFQEGYLYTKGDLLVSDIVGIDSSSTDQKVRRYKVESKESIGLTRDICVRWKIVAQAQ